MSKLEGVVTAGDIMKSKYRELPINSTFKKFLGKLPANEQWKMLVHGIAGSGKSTYSLVLAKEFTRFGNVLYGNFEEAVGPTLQAKLKTAKVKTDKIHYLKSNKESEFWRLLGSGKYKFCIIDSLTHIAKTDKKVKEIWNNAEKFPNVSFIIISHARKTQDGKRESDYKGSSEIGHIVDINQRVVDGVVWNDKNRLLGKDTTKADGYNIFKNTIIKCR